MGFPASGWTMAFGELLRLKGTQPRGQAGGFQMVCEVPSTAFAFFFLIPSAAGDFDEEPTEPPAFPISERPPSGQTSSFKFFHARGKAAPQILEVEALPDPRPFENAVDEVEAVEQGTKRCNILRCVCFTFGF